MARVIVRMQGFKSKKQRRKERTADWIDESMLGKTVQLTYGAVGKLIKDCGEIVVLTRCRAFGNEIIEYTYKVDKEKTLALWA